MPEPLILQALKRRKPRSKEAGKGRYWLDEEDHLYILWGWYQGWSARKTADGVPCSVMPVLVYKKHVVLNPEILFDLPVVLQEGPKKYRCQFCNEIRPSRMRGMRHFLSHIIPAAWARIAPLSQDDIPP